MRRDWSWKIQLKLLSEQGGVREQSCTIWLPCGKSQTQYEPTIMQRTGSGPRKTHEQTWKIDCIEVGYNMMHQSNFELGISLSCQKIMYTSNDAFSSKNSSILV